MSCVVGIFLLGACGGSDSETNEGASADTAVTTVDTTATPDTATPTDPAAVIASFCADAQEQAGSNLAETDDAAAIAEKLGTNADTLEKLAAGAPEEIKADVESTAKAAREMADAVAADPSLDNINDVVTKYATPDFAAASKKVEEFIKTKCGE